MSIYPDKKDGVLTGRWRIEVQLGTMRKRAREDTYDAAKATEARLLSELSTGHTEGATVRSDQAAIGTLSQLLPRASKALWSPQDRHGVLSVAKLHWVIKEVGDIRLEAIPSDFGERLVRKLEEAGRGPATINRYIAAVRAVLKWGHKPARGYVPVMPEFDWQDEDNGRIRWLTIDEEDRLIRTLRALGYDEVADLCIAAIDTGCRRGELLDAKANQLNGNRLHLWETKSGHARTVPLTPRAQAILESRLPWSVKEHTVRRAWDRAKLAMGLAEDTGFVFHALRHTCATRLVEARVNLAVVQKFMGHESINTTLRYAHVSDQLLDEAAQTLSARTAQVEGIARGRPSPTAEADRHRAALEPVE